MACTLILGGSATGIIDCYSHYVFTYTIDSFITISGMFVLAILICLKGMIRSEELDKVKPETLKSLGKYR